MGADLQGYKATVVRDVPYTMMELGLYDLAKSPHVWWAGGLLVCSMQVTVVTFNLHYLCLNFLRKF